MSNRIVQTWYRLRDGTTKVLKKINKGWRDSANAADRASTRIEAANRRQQSSLSGVLASLGRLRFLYLGMAGAVVGVARGFGKAASAASDQENAVRRLNIATKNSSDATDEEIQMLVDLAKERQRVTRFGDEQTISAQAQLATFKLNADQIAELTPRVQDLAEGSRRLGKDNVDLEQSALLVGKAISGNAGELSRYGVVLTDAQREAVQFGNTNEKVAALGEALDDNFKGLSESLTTYEQNQQSAKAAAGDFLETLGSTITQTPAVTEAIADLIGWFEGMGKRVEELSPVFQRFFGVVTGGFRVLASTVGAIYQSIQIGANKLQQNILKAARGIASGLQKIAVGGMRETLKSFVDEADTQLERLEKRSGERFDRLGEHAHNYVEGGQLIVDSLTGQAQAHEEAAEAAEEQADKTTEAEREKQEAIERTRETLKKLKVDSEKLKTGVSSDAREMIDALAQLATDGEASLAELSAAATKATKGFDEQELKAYTRELKGMVDQGKLTEGQFEALTASIHKMDGELKGGVKEFDLLNQAISEAESHRALNQLVNQVTQLGKAGQLSRKEVEGLMDAIDGQRNELETLSPETDKNTESTDRNRQATEKAAEANEKNAEAARSAGFEVEVSAKAQERFNKRLEEFEGIGTFRYLKHFADAAEEAAKWTEHQAQMTEQLARAEERLQRLRDRGLDTVDNLEEGNRDLRFELMRLRGEEEKLAELRERERRKELEAKIAEAILLGEREIELKLRERLKLLEKISEEEKQQAEEKKKQADATERENRSDGGGSQPGPDRSGDRDQSSPTRSGGGINGHAGPARRLEIDLRTHGADPNAPRMNPQDMADLKRDLTRAVLQELNNQQRMGL